MAICHRIKTLHSIVQNDNAGLTSVLKFCPDGQVKLKTYSKVTSAATSLLTFVNTCHRYAELAFMSCVGGISIIGGFSYALSLSRKQDQKAFDQVSL